MSKNMSDAEDWRKGITLSVSTDYDGWPNIYDNTDLEIVGAEGFFGDRELVMAYAHEMVSRWNSHDSLTAEVERLSEALSELKNIAGELTDCLEAKDCKQPDRLMIMKFDKFCKALEGGDE